jgi:hypothetical protein
MDANDLLEIKRLCQIRVADMRDKTSALDMIRKYINEGANYCMTCDPQVRDMFLTLKKWADGNGIAQTK